MTIPDPDSVRFRRRRLRTRADGLADEAATLVMLALRFAQDPEAGDHLLSALVARAGYTELAVRSYQRAARTLDELEGHLADIPWCSICHRRANPYYAGRAGPVCHWCRHIETLLDAIEEHARACEREVSKDARSRANSELQWARIEVERALQNT